MPFRIHDGDQITEVTDLAVLWALVATQLTPEAQANVWLTALRMDEALGVLLTKAREAAQAEGKELPTDVRALPDVQLSRVVRPGARPANGAPA